MRIAIDLDGTTARKLEELCSEQDLSLAEAIEFALRRGLGIEPSSPEAPGPFSTRSVSLGRCLLDDVANVEEALDLGEGEGRR
ncbi:MAG: hypothetical protein KDD11_21580 [Acidobacteria bacterium]|nr:hypothetical protein [Acidobacteriota bacterium]